MSIPILPPAALQNACRAAARTPIAADLTTRFVRGLEQAAGEPVAYLGLAVSGGPDSLALLLLAHAAMPGRIAAATVDHGLRPEAADEARFIAGICAERSIPHHILRPAGPVTGNVQSVARKLRYGLLDDWSVREGLGYLATAHHADDQLETLLMRLARGSGLSGLSGIRRRYGHVLRPLLDFTKGELIACCAASGLVPVDDPSNQDVRFDRVRMRILLSREPDIFSPAAAVRAADALAESDAALRWSVDREKEAAIVQLSENRIMLNVSHYPREIQRRLLSEALKILNESPRGDSLALALDALRSGRNCSLGAILCRVDGEQWCLSPAPPRKSR